MRKGFCLLGLIILLSFAHAQIVVPVFGVRGNVPEALVEAFMAQLRQDIEAEGFRFNDGELIPSGLAGSLEPQWAYFAAEVEGERYAVLGEIQESQTAYTVNILVGDKQDQRSSDIISEPLDPAQIAVTSSKLAQNIRDFLQPTMPLVEGSASLFVSSQPSGATLLINGIDKSLTGQGVIELQPGSYLLEVRLEGYEPQERMVELTEGKWAFEPFSLTPAAGGSLGILSVPTAEVFIDDRSMGFTPRTVSALPGAHQIRLQRAGFEPYISEHLVKDNRVSRVGRIILTPQFARMVYWETKDALLLILDDVVQTSGYAELSPGEHTVKASKDGQETSFTFIMPEVGVFRLDFENRSLEPHPQ